MEPKIIAEITAPKNANYLKKCILCGRQFKSVRYDARFCTHLCYTIFRRNSSEIQVKNAKKTLIILFDFVERVQPGCGEFKELQSFLKKNCGIPKSETSSVKKVDDAVTKFNKESGKDIFVFTYKYGRGGTHITLTQNK